MEISDRENLELLYQDISDEEIVRGALEEMLKRGHVNDGYCLVCDYDNIESALDRMVKRLTIAEYALKIMGESYERLLIAASDR